MTDAPTPEIRHYFDPESDGSEMCKCGHNIRSGAHIRMKFYSEEELSSAIAQALQDERAKRGAVIARAKELAQWLDSAPVCMIAGCTCMDERRRILKSWNEGIALDPEATQAWDALRERERKLRELADEWDGIAATLKNGFQLEHGVRGAHARESARVRKESAKELRAVLAETEGPK